MNLSELAQFVCSKVRQTDAVSTALCKGYLGARFQMIWDSELWRDSLVMVTTTLDPTQPSLNSGLDAAGVWLLPRIANKVVAIRDHDRAYISRNAEEYFRMDLDEFGATGTAIHFHILPSCVAAFGSPTPVWITGTNPNDAQSLLHVRGVNAGGDMLEMDCNLGQNTNLGNILEITTATKKATQGFAIFTDQLKTRGYLTMDPAQTAAPQLCRVQIVEIPTRPVNLRALVKRTMPPFVNDEDVPQLRNIENVLIAFAQADMLQQTRQYAKAQLLQQEGTALLMDIKREEVYQQAATPRVIPDVEPPASGYYGGGWLGKG